jgi:hypothetical protein
MKFGTRCLIVTHHNRVNIPANNIKSTISPEISMRGTDIRRIRLECHFFGFFANRNIFQPRH